MRSFLAAVDPLHAESVTTTTCASIDNSETFSTIVQSCAVRFARLQGNAKSVYKSCLPPPRYVR